MNNVCLRTSLYSLLLHLNNMGSRRAWAILFHALVFCALQYAQASYGRSKSRCPALNPDIRCIHHFNQCHQDHECGKSQICCTKECGNECVNIVKHRPERNEIAPVCILPKDLGPCRGIYVRYYYDLNAGKCLEFAYGGCRGNGNRFNTREECLTTCTNGVTVPSMCPTDRFPYCYGKLNRNCQDDSSCHAGKKCCKLGCYYGCVKPVKKRRQQQQQQQQQQQKVTYG